MSYRLKRQRNNTSGITGLRLRHRFTRTGLLRFFIEVSWQDNKRRAGTSIPVSPDDYLRGTLRALIAHKTRTGVDQGFSARTAWASLVDGYKRVNGRRRHG